MNKSQFFLKKMDMSELETAVTEIGETEQNGEILEDAVPTQEELELNLLKRRVKLFKRACSMMKVQLQKLSNTGEVGRIVDIQICVGNDESSEFKELVDAESDYRMAYNLYLNEFRRIRGLDSGIRFDLLDLPIGTLWQIQSPYELDNEDLAALLHNPGGCQLKIFQNSS